MFSVLYKVEDMFFGIKERVWILDCVWIGNSIFKCFVFIVGYFECFKRGCFEILEDCIVILFDWFICKE